MNGPTSSAPPTSDDLESLRMVARREAYDEIMGDPEQASKVKALAAQKQKEADQATQARKEAEMEKQKAKEERDGIDNQLVEAIKEQTVEAKSQSKSLKEIEKKKPPEAPIISASSPSGKKPATQIGM
jgi:hypothetical protein